MINSLQKTYDLSTKLFPGINKFCKKCNICCRTYGWVLPEETKYLSEINCSVATINNNIFCIDSFNRNKDGKIIINQIPRCTFYKKRRCLINRMKPLNCQLYPIKVKFNGKQMFIGVSLGCKYIFSLSSSRKKIIYNNIITFFNEAPRDVIDSYMNIMYEINKITKKKNFLMKNLIKVRKENKSWKMENLKY